jgi:signal peptidase I
MNEERDPADIPAGDDLAGVGWQHVMPGSGRPDPRPAGPGSDRGPDPGPAGSGLAAALTTGELRAEEPAGQAGAQSAEDDDQADAPPTVKRRSALRELAVLVMIALVVALLIKTFVVQMFYIPTGSMENTLIPGDKVLVSKLTYDFRSIQPGDIVVFDGAGSWTQASPDKPSSNPVAHAYDVTLRRLLDGIGGLFSTAPGQTDFVKRVIGVPGDHVVCCNHQGLITLNGVPLRERSYLYPGAAPSINHFNITVPAGRLWVMGDNRAVSDDSRGHMMDPGDGTIPESMVVGRVFAIAWPLRHWRLLPIPATFSQTGIAAKASAAADTSAGPLANSWALGAGTRLRPATPWLPLAAGLVVATPLSMLRRRLRIRPWLRRR